MDVDVGEQFASDQTKPLMALLEPQVGEPECIGFLADQFEIGVGIRHLEQVPVFLDEVLDDPTGVESGGGLGVSDGGGFQSGTRHLPGKAVFAPVNPGVWWYGDRSVDRCGRGLWGRWPGAVPPRLDPATDPRPDLRLKRGGLALPGDGLAGGDPGDGVPKGRTHPLGRVDVLREHKARGDHDPDRKQQAKMSGSHVLHHTQGDRVCQRDPWGKGVADGAHSATTPA